VGSNDGSLYAIDGAGGKQVWSRKTGAPVRCAPAMAGGAVYAGSDNGFMYALDASTGGEKWKFKCGGPVRGAPAIVGGVLLFGANDHNVYALDRRTGKKLWSFRTRYYRHHAAPVIHGDSVYVLPGIDYVHAVDIATGREKWKSFCCKTGEALVWHRDKLWAHGWCLAELDAGSGRVTRFVNQPPYGYNRVTFLGNIMYATGNGGTRAYDLGDPGKQASLGEYSAGRIPSKKSKTKFRGSTYASPAGSPLPLGDKLCFTTKKGEIVLAGPDGSALWTAELGATCHASPAAGEGLLVVGDDKGTVHCFRER
jgi:outer membrane protein assembly factor BamB